MKLCKTISQRIILLLGFIMSHNIILTPPYDNDYVQFQSKGSYSLRTPSQHEMQDLNFEDDHRDEHYTTPQSDLVDRINDYQEDPTTALKKNFHDTIDKIKQKLQRARHTIVSQFTFTKPETTRNNYDDTELATQLGFDNASLPKPVVKYEDLPFEDTTPQYIKDFKNSSTKQPSIFQKTIDLTTSAKKAFKNAAETVKSTRFGKWISDQVDAINRQINETGAKRTATALARTKATRMLNQQEEETFKKSMDNLTTKEKQDVANEWLEKVEQKFKNQQRLISDKIRALELEEIDTNRELSSDHTIDQINTRMNELEQEKNQNEKDFVQQRHQFAENMRAILPKNEVIVGLRSRPTNTLKFEIIDMKKINPNQPFEEQLKQLTDNQQISTHRTYDGMKFQIEAQDLRTLYSTWIARQITIDPNSTDSADEQLATQFKQLTGYQWNTCDKSILTEIHKYLPKAYVDLKIKDGAAARHKA